MHLYGHVTRLCLASIALCSLASGESLSTSFTYQGRLLFDSKTITGIHDFRFSLYDAAQFGNQIGLVVDRPQVNVVNGLFTLTLDFGNEFCGEDTWLEIAVRKNDNNDPNAFVTLQPRQLLTSSPHALYAKAAGSLKGGLNWLDLNNRPAGLDDGDDTGLVSESDPQVGSIETNRIPRWNGSALVTGTIYDNGNIGIGTTDPEFLLHVEGEARIAGALNMSNNKISNVASPTFSSDVATKGYVDALTLSPIKSIQFGVQGNRGNGVRLPVTISISPVNTSKSFILLNGGSDGFGDSGATVFVSAFTSTSFTVDGNYSWNPTDAVFSWQVIEAN